MATAGTTETPSTAGFGDALVTKIALSGPSDIGPSSISFKSRASLHPIVGGTSAGPLIEGSPTVPFNDCESMGPGIGGTEVAPTMTPTEETSSTDVTKEAPSRIETEEVGLLLTMESAKGNSEVGTKELSFKDGSRNAPSPMDTEKVPLIGTTETDSAVGTTCRTKELSSTDRTTQALPTIESEVVLLTTGTSARSVVMAVQKSASVKASLLNGYIPEARKPLAAAATVAVFGMAH